MAKLPAIRDDGDDRSMKDVADSNKANTDSINALVRENRRSREQERDNFSRERSKKAGKDGRDAIDAYFAKFKRDDDEIMFRKRVTGQLDGIQSTLDKMLKNSKEENESLLSGLSAGLMRLLPALIPLITAAIAAANPEAVKPYTTAAKSAMAGAGMASDAIKGTKYVAEAAKGAKVLGAAGKALGKFSDNKHMNTLVRATSGGMIVGRALEGDGVGATGEAASLAMHEAARKAKSPKAKALLTAGSLATDAALIVRDWFKSDAEKEAEAKKQQEEAAMAGAVGGASGGGTGAQALTSSGEPTAFDNIKKAAIVILPSLIAIAVPLILGRMKGGAALGGLTDMLGGKKGTPNVPDSVARQGTKLASKKPLNILSIGNKVTATPTISNVGGGMFAKAGGATSTAASTVGNAASKAGSIAKVGGKIGARAIPLAGLALGAYGTVTRAMDGDYVGALGEAVSGIVSTVPMIGTAAAVAIQGGLMYRDSVRADAANQTNAVNGNIKRLDNAAKNTADQSALASEAIIKSSDNTIASTNAMTANVGAATTEFSAASAAMGTGLLGFTASLGSNFLRWTIGADNIFKSAANRLAAIGSGIWSNLKSLAVGGAGLAAGVGGWLGNQYDKLTGNDAASYTSKLGSVAAKFEGGSVGTVSTGKGDKGGVSYGKHQLSSKSGTMMEFLKSKQGAAYRHHFVGMTIGSAQFNAKYKQVAAADGAGFENAQQKFITATHFAPVANQIKAKTGIDVTRRGRAIQELAYSMSVQYRGNTAGIWAQALKGRNANSLSDSEIINLVMSRRMNGVDADFKSSSASVRNGVRNRIRSETAIYQKMEASGIAPKQAVDSKGAVATPKAASSGSAAAAKGNSSAKGAAGADFDLDKICQAAVSGASKTSLGKCAEYVRKAMQAGDSKGKIKGGLGHARDWGSSLPKIGWSRVSGSPQKGDIAWFPTGMKGYGHVCIWTGAVWVSDFIQRTVQPNSSANLQYHLFRANSGYSNGAAVGAAGAGGYIDDTADGEGGSTGGAEGTEEEKSAIEKAQDAVTSSIAAIGDALFNNDAAQAAVNFFDGAKVDGYDAAANRKDAVDMTGFDKELKGQGAAFKYDFGQSGVDRNELFDRNAFERQKASPTDLLGMSGSLGGVQRQLGSSIDHLGMAGDLGGIHRQKDSPLDHLGMAGDLGGIMRQEDSPIDHLGMAGDLGGIQRQGAKKKKLKWYDKLFGGEHSGLFKDIFGAFGLGGIFDLGQGAYSADKNGTLDEYGLKKLGEFNKQNQFGMIFDEAGKILSAEKNGTLPQYGINKMSEILNNMNGEGSLLTPDYVGRNNIDGIISSTNKQYADYKNAPAQIDTSGLSDISSNGIASAKQGTTSGGSSSGLSGALITRNPESIFREVSIAIMKATVT